MSASRSRSPENLAGRTSRLRLLALPPVPYNGATVFTRPPRRSPPFVVSAVALLALTAAPPPARAPGNFKITYQDKRTDPTRVELAGNTFNAATGDAIEGDVTP